MRQSKNFARTPEPHLLSHLVDGNNGRCLPDGRKKRQTPEKIENLKKKIHARASKVL